MKCETCMYARTSGVYTDYPMYRCTLDRLKTLHKADESCHLYYEDDEIVSSTSYCDNIEDAIFKLHLNSINDFDNHKLVSYLFAILTCFEKFYVVELKTIELNGEDSNSFQVSFFDKKLYQTEKYKSLFTSIKDFFIRRKNEQH